MSRSTPTLKNTRAERVQRRRRKKKQNFSTASKRSNKLDAKLALDSFFGTDDIFSDYKLHGNIKWSASNVARIALLFAWSEKICMKDAFVEAVKRSQQLAIKTFHTTYQGFMGALTNYVHLFIPILILRLQQQIQAMGTEFGEVSGFVPIAFDGSRTSAARTLRNEQELCSAKGKRKAIQSPSSVTDPRPQTWITLMWHMGWRLPWDWRLGPSDSSERKHVDDMIESGYFPKNTLFCGDAGFVGYEFWHSIMRRGYHFMVRVGSNVKLISDAHDFQELDDGEVFCWPKGKQGTQPPLRLRLVQVTIGAKKTYLLTSVLSAEKLPLPAMANLYKKRWGIEVEFRGLKQTLNGSKLRCRNPDRLYTELHWSILAMAVAELLAVKEQVASKARNQNYSPQDRSLARTMRAIRKCVDHLHESATSTDDLFSCLANAVTDNYQRTKSKKVRYRPQRTERKKREIKPPDVRKMDVEERARLKKMSARVVT